MINTFGVHLLKYLNNVAVWWHASQSSFILSYLFPLCLTIHLHHYHSVVGTVALVIAVLVKAPTHQSGKFVFSTFIDGTGVDGVGWSERASPAYVAVIGILMAQYTLTGFDASAHVSA